MSRDLVFHKENYKKSLEYDLPAGLVIFLVAIPLCLGIALASGAPMMSGILAAIAGGLVAPFISRAQLSISGPAAGLTAIVLVGIENVGTFDAFLLCVIVGGIVQILLALIKAGYIAYFFPNAVIKGMLSAIGIILILKQFPIAIGYNHEIFGMDKFFSNDEENTFSLIYHSFSHSRLGSIIISVVSLSILILWNKSKKLSQFHWLPSALIVVIFGVLINYIYEYIDMVDLLQVRKNAKSSDLEQSQLVNIPTFDGFKNLHTILTFPDWNYAFSNMTNLKKILVSGLTVGIVASIETLLTVEAVDKLDPFKRKTPLNRELFAQGASNIFSGLIGGLPITSVIVRSSAGINAGARTKVASIVNGVLTLITILTLIKIVNMIPIACLACILLIVGYKLANVNIFKQMYYKGPDQFIPYIVTILAILFSDLLIGITIGTAVGIVFIIRTNFHTPITVKKHEKYFEILFNKDISFLNKAVLNTALERIDENSKVIINGKNAHFIDQDVVEMMEEFRKESELKNIEVEFQNMERAEIRFSNIFFKSKSEASPTKNQPTK